MTSLFTLTVFDKNYDQRIKDAVNAVPEGSWREFAMFAGPRLDRVIGWDNKVVLIGDASHPLSGKISASPQRP